MPDRSGLPATGVTVTSWSRRSASLVLVSRRGIWSVSVTANVGDVTSAPAGDPGTTSPACVKQILGTSTVAPQPREDEARMAEARRAIEARMELTRSRGGG